MNAKEHAVEKAYLDHVAQWPTERKELLTLNGLVATQLGADQVTFVFPDTIVAAGIPDFRPYTASWEDIEQASHDLGIGYVVFEHSRQTKARLTFDGPNAALALVFRVPDKSKDQPECIIPHLLRFYLRTRDWNWDNKAPIAGYDELFEKWFHQPSKS